MAKVVRHIQKNVEYQDNREPSQTGHYVPLHKMSPEAVVRGVCPDCSLEREHSVSELLHNKSLRMSSVEQLKKVLPCRRCEAEIDYEIIAG